MLPRSHAISTRTSRRTPKAWFTYDRQSFPKFGDDRDEFPYDRLDRLTSGRSYGNLVQMFIAAIAFGYRSFGKFVMLAAGFFCESKASSLITPPEFRDKNRLPAVYNFVSSLKWIEKHTEYGVKHTLHLLTFRFLPFCGF